MCQEWFLENFTNLKFIIMLCPMLIVALSLALIVLMGGLFLLAFSKKEALGKLTTIASYVAIVFGAGAFIGGLICATLCTPCHKSKCSNDRMECSKDKKECFEVKMERCEKDVKNEKKVIIIRE
ncbi:MAG: hypothetical protein RL528_1550 [Bacteroidota bacterium]|jgi:uncharacterized membrane protein YciS (DUF1049 family)